MRGVARTAGAELELVPEIEPGTGNGSASEAPEPATGYTRPAFVHAASPSNFEDW